MSRAVGDVIEAKVDPALLNRSGDPQRRLPACEHRPGTLSPPVYESIEGHGAASPTQDELNSLQRVPAPIPWRVCTFLCMIDSLLT
jgi:POT family proton-dependent oligopeptide transporter